MLDAPENMVAEVVDGDLSLSPRPAPAHASATMALSGELVPAFGRRGGGGPGGWLFLVEPELHLGLQPHILVPDLAAWRRERLAAVSRKEAFIELPPDWICEVLSPLTARLDRTRKLGVYAEFGVGHAWLIDPLARTLEVLRLEAGRWVLLGAHGGDARVRAEPFEALELGLAELWAFIAEE